MEFALETRSQQKDNETPAKHEPVLDHGFQNDESDADSNKDDSPSKKDIVHAAEFADLKNPCANKFN